MRSKKEPSDYIKAIHEDYLLRICKESGLKGLTYHGGPKVKCCNSEKILYCVVYDGDEPVDMNLTPTCYECLNEYDVIDLLVSNRHVDSMVYTPLQWNLRCL